MKAAKKKKSQLVIKRKSFSENDIKSVSGIPVAPIEIESYERATVTNNEAQIINKLGINSIIIDNGDILPVKVFGTKNALGMLVETENSNYLQ